jgi:hypothetical protein
LDTTIAYVPVAPGVYVVTPSVLVTDGAVSGTTASVSLALLTGFVSTTEPGTPRTAVLVVVPERLEANAAWTV